MNLFEPMWLQPLEDGERSDRRRNLVEVHMAIPGAAPAATVQDADNVVRTCRTCGKANRIPLQHLARKGRCGACKAALPSLDEPLNVGTELFRAIVKESPVPILIDFWAAWCGPCRAAAPEVAKAAKALAGRGIVLKVDTERYPDVANLFQVRGIPNFVVVKDQQMVFQQAGLVNHQEMVRWVVEAAGVK